MMDRKLFFISFLLSFPYFLHSQADTAIKQELSMIFIGDFMGHQDQIDAAYNSKTGRYNYDSCFQYIAPLLSDADFTIGNLELTLGVKPYSGYPQFSSPPDFAKAISNAGVDILSTVNNHSVDKSDIGINRTIFNLDSLNISRLGTYLSPDDKDSLSPLIIEKNGIRIALLSYTYGTNSLIAPPPYIVNYLDSTVIANDVANAKIKNPDAIIVFVHWGIQYTDFPSNNQKDWNSYFKSLGVKIIIGSHPHVVQPMEWRKNDSSLVVYSLGNFVSHQRTFPRDGGSIVKIRISKKANRINIEEANYALTWVYEYVENNKKKYLVLPVKEFENNPDFFKSLKDFNKMQRYIKHARNHLNTNNVNFLEY